MRIRTTQFLISQLTFRQEATGQTLAAIVTNLPVMAHKISLTEQFVLVNSLLHQLILFRLTVDPCKLTHLLKVFPSFRDLDVIQASQALDFGECQTVDKLHRSSQTYGSFRSEVVVLGMTITWAHALTECCVFKVLALFVRFRDGANSWLC